MPPRGDENRPPSTTSSRTRQPRQPLSSSLGPATRSASKLQSISGSTSNTNTNTTTTASMASSTRKPGPSKPRGKENAGDDDPRTNKDRDSNKGKGAATKERALAAQTPRRALSVVTQQETPAVLATTLPKKRPTVRRALTNPNNANTAPIVVHTPHVAKTAPRPKAKLPSTAKPKPATQLKASSSSSSRSKTSTPTPGPSTTAAAAAPPPLRPKSPHTPEDRIGINPLKRGAPTTFDRPTDRKFRRIGETSASASPVTERVVMFDDEVESCVPFEEPDFVPLDPPAAVRDIEDTQDVSLPPDGLSLPPIPAEVDGADDLGLDLPELLDPEQLELDLGELDLPDIDFVV